MRQHESMLAEHIAPLLPVIEEPLNQNNVQQNDIDSLNVCSEPPNSESMKESGNSDINYDIVQQNVPGDNMNMPTLNVIDEATAPDLNVQRIGNAEENYIQVDAGSTATEDNLQNIDEHISAALNANSHTLNLLTHAIVQLEADTQQNCTIAQSVEYEVAEVIVTTTQDKKQMDVVKQPKRRAQPKVDVKHFKKRRRSMDVCYISDSGKTVLCRIR